MFKGQRFLWRDVKANTDGAIEGKVIEISKMGGWVKIKTEIHTDWRRIESIKIIDYLEWDTEELIEDYENSLDAMTAMAPPISTTEE